MKAAGGHPLVIPPSPSGLGEDAIEAMKAEITPSSRDEQHTLKEQCLARDGNKCVLTHWGDDVKPPPGPDPQTAPTQCAHILPFALRSFDERSVVEVSRPSL